MLSLKDMLVPTPSSTTTTTRTVMDSTPRNVAHQPRRSSNSSFGSVGSPHFQTTTTSSSQKFRPTPLHTPTHAEPRRMLSPKSHAPNTSNPASAAATTPDSASSSSVSSGSYPSYFHHTLNTYSSSASSTSPPPSLKRERSTTIATTTTGNNAASASSAKKRCVRPPYSAEQDDFIRFVRDDLCHSWDTSAKLYNQFWHPNGEGKREIPGLQSRYYRLLPDPVRERKKESVGRPELGILTKTERRYWWMDGMYDPEERLAVVETAPTQSEEEGEEEEAAEGPEELEEDGLEEEFDDDDDEEEEEEEEEEEGEEEDLRNDEDVDDTDEGGVVDSGMTTPTSGHARYSDALKAHYRERALRDIRNPTPTPASAAPSSSYGGGAVDAHALRAQLDNNPVGPTCSPAARGVTDPDQDIIKSALYLRHGTKTQWDTCGAGQRLPLMDAIRSPKPGSVRVARDIRTRMRMPMPPTSHAGAQLQQHQHQRPGSRDHRMRDVSLEAGSR